MAQGGGNNGQFPAKLPLLDGKNYDRWIIQIKAVFRYQEVLDVVRNVIAVDGGEPQRDQQKKDSKALFLIHQCVDAEAFEKIAQYETAKEAWDALATAYSGDVKLKKVKLQTLRRQYESLQMGEKESIAEYFNNMTMVTNQMRVNGETISDQAKIEKVLRTLPPRFDSLVNAIEQAKNLETMKLEELQGSLEAQEARFNERINDKEKEKIAEKSDEQALQAQFRKGKTNWKNKKGKRN